MERPHRAVPMTGAMGLAVACRIAGSIPHALATRGPRPEEIRVAHASGVVAVGAEVQHRNTGWHAESAVVFRTQRRLMQGAVAIPG
jgi:2-methylaconitate cis-trans-isomerase PrpF